MPTRLPRRALGKSRLPTSMKRGATHVPSTARSRSSNRKSGGCTAAVRRRSCWQCCSPTLRPTIMRWCAAIGSRKRGRKGSPISRGSGTNPCAPASYKTAPPLQPQLFRNPILRPICNRRSRPKLQSRRSSALTPVFGMAGLPITRGYWRCRARSPGSHGTTPR